MIDRPSETVGDGSFLVLRTIMNLVTFAWIPGVSYLDFRLFWSVRMSVRAAGYCCFHSPVDGGSFYSLIVHEEKIYDDEYDYIW